VKKSAGNPLIIHSIAEFHQIMKLPKPQHPLISITKLHGKMVYPDLPHNKLIHDFYSIYIKKNYKGAIRYGRKYYDFCDGVMSFSSPRQVFTLEPNPDLSQLSGWCLLFHPDFIRNYTLGKLIKDYGFFSYDVNEALHLSDKEEVLVETIFTNILQEYQSPIDTYSHDVMISHLELLLNYSNRFYNRQFITRKPASNDLLASFEEVLTMYFETNQVQQTGLPSVQYISDQLKVSPSYLSDMLKTLTGQSTQQHIHDKLIEKAKQVLTTTTLSVSEIAYQLGFEHPQSFNRLFKSKTNVSPLQFRQSFN
jgi:AraC family transcriptional regulator, transcriptional activator of pobA